MVHRQQVIYPTVSLLVGAVAGWLLPGAGYFLLGEKKRAIIIFVTITLTLCTGLYIGSIGVIDFKGPAALYVKAAQFMNPPIVLFLGYHSVSRLLFNIALDSEDDLAGDVVADGLRQEFGKKGISLGEGAAISTGQRANEWLIHSNGRSYTIKEEWNKLKETNEMNVYTAYPVHGWPNEIGQIYTMSSGLLNLLCIVNAIYLAHRRGSEPAGG